MVKIRFLYRVHKVALVIRLIKFDFDTYRCGVLFYQIYKVFITLPAVYFGFADTEHIDVRSVQNKKFHYISSSFRTACATAPISSFDFTVTSAAFSYIGNLSL